MVCSFHAFLRWAVSSAVVASTLLCVVVRALWLRSYTVNDQVGRIRRTVSLDTVTEYRSGLFSGGGRISIAKADFSWTRQQFVSDHGPLQPHEEDRFGWSSGSLKPFFDERDESFLLDFGSNTNYVQH